MKITKEEGTNSKDKRKQWCDIHKWGTHNNENCKNQLVCTRCDKSGHKKEECRTILCEYCKDVLKNDKFLGHLAEKCFYVNRCPKCNKTGHCEDKCLSHYYYYRNKEINKKELESNDVRQFINKDDRKEFPELI